MSQEESKLEAMVGHRVPEGEFLSEERRYWLALIIPPLVHRLNNALLVVSGSSAFSPSPGEAEAEDGEYECLSGSLRHLSLFSKSHSASMRTVNLGRLAESILLLAQPYANERGVELELRMPVGECLAQGSQTRLQQWMLCLVLNLVWATSGGTNGDARGADSSLPLARIRLALHLLKQGPCLQVSAPLSVEQCSSTRGVLEAHATWRAESKILSRARHLGRTSSFRILLPRVEGSSPFLRAQPAPVPKRQHLVLVHADQELRGLLRDLLEGEAYRVQALASLDDLDLAQKSGGLLLVDLDALQGDGGFLESLIKARGSLRQVLVLGTPRPGELAEGWANVPCLAKPFRPAELLDGVRALA